MKLKNTLYLLLIASVLLGFIWFYESKQLSTTEAKEQAGRIVTFDRDKVQEISIKTAETKVELRKDEKGGWVLVAPVKDRADSMVISQLFTSAEALRYDAMIGDAKKGPGKEELKEFGLTNSETKVKFSGTEKPVELVFGKDSAVEGKVYVKLEGSDAAYVIGKDLRDQISRRVDDFRDRRLMNLDTTQVRKLTLKTAAGVLEAEKTNDEWQLSKPLKARGDTSKINDLVAQAVNARIEAFSGDEATQAVHGLQEPRAVLTLESEGGGEPLVLQIGANPKEEKDKEKAFAKLSSRDAVVLLPKSIEALLEVKPNDLRDRHLMRVEADIVDRMNIEPAGQEKIVVARSGESWVRKVGDKELPINVVAARRLLDEIRHQQVAEFVADVATELPRYGLDQPRVKLTFSSYASENTAESKAGEKPIASVVFGKTENGNVYAKLEDEPFIVSVPEASLDVVITDPIQWQPLEIHNHRSEDFTTLEISKNGQAPVTLERAPDMSWKLAKGDGTVDQVAVQSLVNTLATLRAVRWSGEVVPELGLEKPILTVQFKTTAGGGKLLLGASSPEELTYAAAEGLAGAFLLSKPDVSAFLAPVLEKAPAAATPAPNAAEAPMIPPALPVTAPPSAQ